MTLKLRPEVDGFHSQQLEFTWFYLLLDSAISFMPQIGLAVKNQTTSCNNYYNKCIQTNNKGNCISFFKLA